MSHVHTFDVCLSGGTRNKGGIVEAYTVPGWPDNAVEAIKLWGDPRTMGCINGSSAQVQVQQVTRAGRSGNKPARSRVQMQTFLSANGGWKPALPKVRLTSIERLWLDMVEAFGETTAKKMLDALPTDKRTKIAA